MLRFTNLTRRVIPGSFFPRFFLELQFVQNEGVDNFEQKFSLLLISRCSLFFFVFANFQLCSR